MIVFFILLLIMLAALISEIKTYDDQIHPYICLLSSQILFRIYHIGYAETHR